MARQTVLVLVFSVVGALPVSRATAQPLAVAAAADLQPVMPALTERFERDAGQRIVVTFGSSGTFYSQIRNGAPFDVFLSADLEYPQRLVADGLAEPESLYEYAAGRLVLWARKDQRLDLSRGLRVLEDRSVRRIAIANPEHAPYGRAAVAALKHEGVYEQVRGKLVLGENVAQTAQFVESGNAQAGLIALSLASAPPLRDVGAHHEVSPSAYPRLAQAVVVLRHARNRAAAVQFVAFLKRPEARRLLEQFGFAAPSASAK